MESERKLFKFYRSYFDVASELPDKDRLLFYDAIMQRQFFGTEPNLKGIAKLAYISQKFNVDAQVKGWEDKMKIQLSENHPTQPPIEPPTQQEEEKEKEEVKDKREKPKVFTPPIISDVIDYFIENGYTEISAKKAFNYYDCADWIDKNGNKIRSWKQKMQGVWFKDENALKVNNEQVFSKVKYIIDGETVTHNKKAYLENLEQYGEQRVKFIKYVE